MTIALCTYIVLVLMRLFGRVVLNCCRSRITPHERRATLFNYRQAASSTLLHPAACTILLEAVRAWLQLCRAAASVFRFLFTFIASPRYLIHEVAHPHCSNHHGESSLFPCPHCFHQNSFSLNTQQSSGRRFSVSEKRGVPQLTRILCSCSNYCLSLLLRPLALCHSQLLNSLLPPPIPMSLSLP